MHSFISCYLLFSVLFLRYLVFFFFFYATATPEIYTILFVGSVRCVQETGILPSVYIQCKHLLDVPCWCLRIGTVAVQYMVILKYMMSYDLFFGEFLSYGDYCQTL
eukprot:TRINITY_DN24029_c0_g1_i1.p4 TRINITY_DN24029_c0_g1~~TRINITY_DN24029_c0_g1_i1.p4  ORF type:complete len:106 (+),score=2.66 TRINITY_DN24029_c0_g1_i1:18-335(+)